ncbi:glycosyltransferase involved in cell wall biosynthesis [Flavobacteriaceae bacterium MAR_2010_72]|nr:glycosyltransferase involved in cell wall biosynthesis [Flavobacteriaceae bacterium MAR_2010_72]
MSMLKKKEPIHICFVTREYAHSQLGKTGGIGVFLKQFTNVLKAHRFTITVFTFGSKPIRFDDAGVSVVKIRDLSGFTEWIKAPLRRYNVPGYISIKILLDYLNRFYISMRLSVFVWRQQFDLLEFHDYGGDAPFFIGKLPKVIRCHGSAVTLHQFMGYTKRITDTIFERILFKRFPKNVIAVSQYSAQITQEAFQLHTQPKVIYNGVAVPKTDQDEGKGYDAPPTLKHSVFYFGSLRERKGINIACDVFNTLVKQFPDASFHVMGPNNNRHWETVARPLLSADALKQTTYYGAIANDHIASYLKQAHVVLFPSYGENFSIALLEVMALGKVVVTSNIPAFNELIKDGENGLMAQSPTDYFDQITKVFKKELPVEAISKQALHTINSQFEWQSIIQDHINYYYSLLPTGPKPKAL